MRDPALASFGARRVKRPALWAKSPRLCEVARVHLPLGLCVAVLAFALALAGLVLGVLAVANESSVLPGLAVGMLGAALGASALLRHQARRGHDKSRR